MQTARVTTYLFLFLSLFHSYTFTETKKNSITPITAIDDLVNFGQKQLNQISIALTTLSGIINDNIAKTIKNKKATLDHIKKLNGLIGTLRKEKFAQVDLATAQSLFSFNKALIRHLIWAFHNNFENIEQFDINALIKKSAPTSDDISPEEVIQTMYENENGIILLTQKADSFGLRWYNRAYRKLDDYIISPCARYSVPTRGLIGTGISFLGIYFWKQWGMQHYKNNAHRLIKSFFGENDLNSKAGAYRIGNVEIDDTNFGTLAPLEKAEVRVGQFLNNLLPIAKLVYGGVTAGLVYEYHNHKQDIAKKTKEWVNALRGGSYLREAQRAADRVDEVYFKDIFGQEEIIRYFQLLVDYLENPEPFDRLGLTPPKGILCIGDTRTGKTFAVTALFNEIKKMHKQNGASDRFKYFNLSAADINKFGITTWLNGLKHMAPCIVFIDEIDLLDLQRTGKNETLSEFLTCMSGTLESKDSKNQVIIIAATNRPENLDIALRQPGRFGKELRFEYPNSQDRRSYISHKLEKLSLNLEEFDIDKLTKETHSKSYEALKLIIDNALLKARIQGEPLTQQHLEETLEEDVYHIIPNNSKQIPQHEKEILGAHFAGQALALMLLDGHTKLSKVTIKQVMTDIKEEMMGNHLWGDKEERQEQKRFEYGKLFMHHENDSINMNTKDEKLKLCQVYLAGFAAEEILLGSCGYSCHAQSDKSNAMMRAQSIAYEGLDSKKAPKAIAQEKYKEALDILAHAYKEIKTVLAQYKDTLMAISSALQEKGTLNAQEIRILMEGATQAA